MMYFILGTVWLRVDRNGQLISFPIGLPVGLLINQHEKLQIDQKIEIAVLVVSTFLSFFLPLGIVVAL
jgi:ABC-type dipeptide/oligopeptide/nickel transport system permease component